MIRCGILTASLLWGGVLSLSLEAQPSSPDAAVYTAVLRATRDGAAEEQLVFDSTSTRRVSGSRFVPARSAAFWAAVPKGVQAQFDSVNRTAQSLRGLVWPPWVRLLSLPEWTARERRLARAGVIDIGSVAVLSRIAYAPDSTAALVQVARPCNGPCGGATYYWVRRTASGEWVVQEETEAWTG
jgi:hypothetical protein